MSTAPRRPLPPLNEYLRLKLAEKLGRRPDNNPPGLTAAELQAAANPGVADPNWKEKPMETKPGWQTSEYWLKLLVVLVVLPVLVFFGGDASPLPEMMDALKAAGPLAAVVAAIAAKGVPAFVAWLASRLAAKYGEERTQLKLAALKSANEG